MSEKKCTHCNTTAQVPYVIHESEVNRLERIIKRQWIALILVICMLFACNGAWIYAWTQYDYESYELTADGNSNASFIGEDGNIYNGGYSKSEKTKTEKPNG